MPHFKDPSDHVHFLDSGAFEHLLPAGCISISDAEAETLRQSAEAQRLAAAVPGSVTMRQARLALLAAGHLIDVNAAIAALPGVAGEAARIEWEFSATVERQRPLVQALSGALGWTEPELDALFIAAAAL